MEIKMKKKNQYDWEDINKAMTYNNMSPAKILRILSTLKKMQSGGLTLEFVK